MSEKLNGKYANIGLLIIRVGLGVMFIFHGYPKLMGGPEQWVKLGQAMEAFGISFLPGFWGFMAAFAEFFGGAFLIMGILFQPACALLLVTMIVAAAMHFDQGHGLKGASHAIEAGIVFLGLLLTGPGSIRFSSK